LEILAAVQLPSYATLPLIGYAVCFKIGTAFSGTKIYHLWTDTNKKQPFESLG
jgi:hypothetical protein